MISPPQPVAAPAAEPDDQEDIQNILLNNYNGNVAAKFPSNFIKTAKYSVISFLPLNLFEQFQRFSNLYFLLTAIISVIPGISPISPFTTVSPLVFVLAVTAVKDALEDYTRHKADKKANSSIYKVLRVVGTNAEFKDMQSADICTGDIVYVEKGRQFPADLVALGCSEDEGVCYVETSNLDGETNLKRRNTPRQVAHVRELDEVKKMTGKVVCEGPNVFLYKFEGTLTLGTETIALNANNILLRGAQLRNTKYIYGLVVYAGVDSKLFRNLAKSPVKVSRMQKMLNKTVLAIFLLNLAWIAAAGALAGYYHTTKVSAAWYMGSIATESALSIGGITLLTYFILFTYLIPISLFVTLELVRVAQALFMEWDPEMASRPDDVENTHCLARNSNMNEELGQIEHVFSDKTGTLTRNIMAAALWSVGGRLYDQRNDDLTLAKARRGEIHGAGTGIGTERDNITEFLRVMALCNTVVPETHEDGKRTYEAQSPDEGALVDAARINGVELVNRIGARVIVAVDGVNEEYEVLATLEFSSDRKRMSVICKYPDGSIRLLCKGADVKILERLRKDDPLVPPTMDHLGDAAKFGLRTLLVGVLTLEASAVEAWMKKFNEAETATKDRVAKVEAVEEVIEQGLTLLGATAVEDKLQDRVPETIKYLLEAGVNVWVLTGDKMETAENIGYSSRLLQQGNYLIKVVGETANEVEGILDAQTAIMKGSSKPSGTPALMIDGHSLTFALSLLSKKFLTLTDFCQAVICCRVTPLQKSEVVALVKKEKGTMTLAIGDGANDVSMIQTAHVGIGVVGNEGTQAVRASDYAIQEFRLLAPLLTKHGRYSALRIGTLIQYSFYKNILYIFPQFLFGFWSCFSGQIVYDQIILTSFNIVWAALPPLLLGIFEQDVNSATIQAFPQLYKTIKKEPIFSMKTVLQWGFLAFYHGTVVFMVCYFAVTGWGVVLADGRNNDLWTVAIFTATVGILMVLAKACLILNHWNVIVIVGMLISVIGYLLFLIIYCQTYSVGVAYDVALQLFSTANFWLSIVITIFIALVPDFVARYIKQTFMPADWQVMREAERLPQRAPPQPRIPGRL